MNAVPSTRHAVHQPALSTRPILLDHGLQSVLLNSLNYGYLVYLQSRWIMASKFAQWSSPSASRNSLHLGVHLEVHLIMASKFISKYTRLPPPSASLKLLDHGLQVHTNALHVHLQIRSITISEGISMFTRPWNPCVSPHILQYLLEMHLETPWITVAKFALSWSPTASANWLGQGLGVYRAVHSIIILRRTSNSFEALPAASSDILGVDG